MGFFTKAVFVIGLLYVLYSTYGAEFLENSSNRSKMPTETEQNVSSIVHSLEIPMQRDGHYWLDMQVSNHDFSLSSTLVLLA